MPGRSAPRSGGRMGVVRTGAGIAELLQQAGFVRAATTRNWGTTFALDLQPSEDELFGSFSPTVRRAIRSVAKLPVQVRSIDDRRSASRLDALSSEAFARTGARYQEVWDWEGVIELSRRAPDASRLVGLFRTDREGPEALLGFVWGWWNGESGSYFAGASRRFLLRVMGAEILAPALRTLGRRLLSIFTLHRFTDPDLGVVGHDPALLRYHLAYLRRHHYRLFSLTDVVRQIENGGTGGWGGRAPAVAFSVDDGYAGYARIAAPIFAEYDCPVTLFVTTGFLDGQL